MPNSLIDLAGLQVGAEEFLGAVLKMTAQPIWVIDRDGVSRFANPAAITALGYERADELSGPDRHATRHYRHKDGSPFSTGECPLLRPLATGDTVTCELDWLVRRDGSMFPVSYVSVAVELPAGRCVVVAFTDIEARLRAEETRGQPDETLPARHAALRDELARLADEQAALRRVATLVARGVAPAELFAAVACEVGLLVGGDATHVWRFQAGGTASVIASWTRVGEAIPVGTVAAVEGDSVCALVLRSGGPARMNSYAGASGPIASMMQHVGVRSSVGAPIVVDGGHWGAMIVSSKDERLLPADTEARSAAFMELIATAISNAEARAEAARLADEQSALRRVATLVAQGVPPGELFGAVVAEVGGLLGADLAGMIRYEPEETISAVATWAAVGEHPAVRGRWSLAGDRLATTIARTSRPAREDDWAGASGAIAEFVRHQLGIDSSVGSPVVVEGRVWGALFVHGTHGEPLPIGTEARLGDFTELVATAVSNSEARAEVERLADEQAGLRRVATLVAREASPSEVFAAVGEEVTRLLRVEDMSIFRYDDNGTATLVATSRQDELTIGDSVPLEGETVTARVFRTGRPARLDDYSVASGRLGTRMREAGIRSAVGAPIVVEGRLWGVIIAASQQDEPLPAGSEPRMGEFTELVATAIANVQARSDLAASRARIVFAADEERRRVVRDLHDGAQQRLIHTVVTLKLARDAAERDEAAVPSLVIEALDHAERATEDLRELTHGVLPAVLTRGGLRAGVAALASRMPVPVALDVSVDRLPPTIEATAYFVVAEGLNNVAKHAHADSATVSAHIDDDTLRVCVRDDGVGGARPGGSGLVGLRDRVSAVDGRFRVENPVEGGTLIAADIPVHH